MLINYLKAGHQSQNALVCISCISTVPGGPQRAGSLQIHSRAQVDFFRPSLPRNPDVRDGKVEAKGWALLEMRKENFCAALSGSKFITLISTKE